jgi:hypothetical protein
MQYWKYLLYTYFVMMSHYNSRDYITRVLKVLAVGIINIRDTKDCNYH